VKVVGRVLGLNPPLFMNRSQNIDQPWVFEICWWCGQAGSSKLKAERWWVDGRRKTEDGRQKTEDRRRKTEDGRPKTGDRRRETEDGSLFTITYSPLSAQPPEV